MITNNLIKGKVAKILNSRELVINKGSEDGVMMGMKFDIMDPTGVDIIDPDTKINLGSVLRPKVRVEIINLQDRLSVARTYKKTQYNVGGTAREFPSLSSLTSFLLPPKWVTEYETLKTTEATWEALEESESYVKTGDPVVEVLEDKKEKPISE